MTHTARLESWAKDHNHKILWGHCMDDTKGRFRDGTFIHTSYIPDIDLDTLKEGDTVKTLNSTYLLGRPLNVEVVS